eukprot:scaffold4934_cov63-Phaeocystis_antarctica.AAC.2
MPAAHPRPAAQPAAARRCGLSFGRGAAPRAPAAPRPVSPASPGQPQRALHPHLAPQRCGHLVISPQLLQQRLRQRPQLAVGAGVAHGDAWIERVAQLAEDDALLVTAQLRQRHRAARAAAARAIGVLTRALGH